MLEMYIFRTMEPKAAMSTMRKKREGKLVHAFKINQSMSVYQKESAEMDDMGASEAPLVQTNS
jgi:hypothetical protein